MSKIPVRMKRALFRKLSSISRMLLKRRIRITEIPRNEGQIGYTSEEPGGCLWYNGGDHREGDRIR